MSLPGSEGIPAAPTELVGNGLRADFSGTADTLDRSLLVLAETDGGCPCFLLIFLVVPVDAENFDGSADNGIPETVSVPDIRLFSCAALVFVPVAALTSAG